MGQPAKRHATYDDVINAPANMVAELVDGALYLSPRPTPAHSQSMTSLAAELKGPFDRGRGGPGGWIILVEPEIHLGEKVVVPDLAGWRRERMPSIANDKPYFTLSPDWVCEVISPSTASFDRIKKLPLYAADGVNHTWLIDPIARTLDVYRLESGRWSLLVTHGADERVQAEPFDAVTLDLALLWADVEANG